MGTFVHHAPCPKCGSKDNLAVYDDGSSHCFGCGHHENDAEGAPRAPRKGNMKNVQFLTGECRALPKRGITEDTARKFGYFVTQHKGATVQVCNYYKAGELVAQHLRGADKSFSWIGDAGDVELFGQHLWSGGKMVVVTEGEVDALSASQIQGNKWPVVSLPNGAQSAKKYIAKNLEYLESFETVILMFDNDEPGKKAVAECAALFSPGKCKVASLPLKDANDMLVAGKGAELVNAIWQAKPYRPDGIVSAADLWELVSTEEEGAVASYPWPEIDDFLCGLRKRELVTITAGSGIGKSLICREIAAHLLNAGETVGYVALEESNKRTVLGFMSIILNRPLHIARRARSFGRKVLEAVGLAKKPEPTINLPEGISEDDFRAAFDRVVEGNRLFLYDHFGSTDSDNLIAKLRYLARGLNCGWIVLDHLSIVVSGQQTDDERKTIDVTMTKLRSLVEETGVGMLLVNHLKRPDGNKGHEDGLQVSLSHLRGSASIAQLSDIVIGAERDQQSDTPDITTIRVLKNRFSGQTGVAGELKYVRETGRLISANATEFDTDAAASGAATGESDEPF